MRSDLVVVPNDFLAWNIQEFETNCEWNAMGPIIGSPSLKEGEVASDET